MKRKTEAQAIFLNPFYNLLTVQTEVFDCPFAEKETKGNYLFVNGLNRLAHLCKTVLWIRGGHHKGGQQ
jgi:hypothetical protein